MTAADKLAEEALSPRAGSIIESLARLRESSDLKFAAQKDALELKSAEIERRFQERGKDIELLQNGKSTFLPREVYEAFRKEVDSRHDSAKSEILAKIEAVKTEALSKIETVRSDIQSKIDGLSRIVYIGVGIALLLEVIFRVLLPKI